MQTRVLQTDYFRFDGRGPVLERWIHDTDLVMPEPELSKHRNSHGSIVGAQHELGWVQFHGCQVIAIVPEEVHSYWHLDFVVGTPKATGVWEIEGSDWLKMFDPRHLDGHKHFVLEFYDQIVEIIARDLIFGAETFCLETVLEKDNRFNYAYYRHAGIQEELGNLDEAADYYQKYLDSGLEDEDDINDIRGIIKHLRAQITEG